MPIQLKYDTIVNSGSGERSIPREQGHLIDRTPRCRPNAIVAPTIHTFWTIRGAVRHVIQELGS